MSVDESFIDIDMACSAMPLAEVSLRQFAANDWTEIVGQRRHPDPNQRFTLILHEPATTEPPHRDCDVWAAHTGEFGRLAVTHQHP